MLVVFAIVLCFATVSVAKQPSAACINAYNATFPRIRTNCSAAIFKVFYLGGATDTDTRMVCNEDQSCNQMIRNVIDTCGDTVRININPSSYS